MKTFLYVVDSVYRPRLAQHASPINVTDVGSLVSVEESQHQQSRASNLLSACLEILFAVSVPAEVSVYLVYCVHECSSETRHGRSQQIACYERTPSHWTVPRSELVNTRLTLVHLGAIRCWAHDGSTLPLLRACNSDACIHK